VLGVRTNIPFLVSVLDHPRFRDGALDTGFVPEHLDQLLRTGDPPASVIAAAAFLRGSATPATTMAASAAPDPWSTLAGWGRP
jgi:acetyl/propionyl-CoA carboxylase alpha subunit